MSALQKLRGAALPISVIIIAEIAFIAFRVRSDSLAPPSAIVASWFEMLRDGSLPHVTAQTLASMLAGLAIGACAGLAAGCAIGFWRLLYRISYITIEVLRPIPSIALLPLSLLIFGFGYRMEIAIVAFATLWPFLILTHNAVTQVEPRLLEVARVLKLSPLDAALKLVLPAAAPRLVTALRLAAGIALVVAVTAEIVSNPQGLGHELMHAQETLRPARMLAMLVWVGLIGWGLNAALLAFEKHVFAHRGQVDTSVAV